MPTPPFDNTLHPRDTLPLSPDTPVGPAPGGQPPLGFGPANLERSETYDELVAAALRVARAGNVEQAQMYADLAKAEKARLYDISKAADASVERDAIAATVPNPALSEFATKASVGLGPHIGYQVNKAVRGEEVANTVRDRHREAMKIYREDNPIESTAVGLAGSIAPGVILGGVAGAGARGVGLGRGGQMLAAGALPGAIQGAAEADPGERLSGAALGAGVGAVIGRVAPAVAQRVARRLAPMAHRLAGSVDEATQLATMSDATEAQAKEALRQFLIDPNSPVKSGGTVEGLLRRIGAPSRGGWKDNLAGAEARKAFQRGVLAAVEEGIEDGTISAAKGEKESLNRALDAVRAVMQHSTVTGKAGNKEAEAVVRAVKYAAKTHAKTVPPELAPGRMDRAWRAMGAGMRGMSFTDRAQGLVRGAGGALQEIATPQSMAVGKVPLVPKSLLPSRPPLASVPGLSGGLASPATQQMFEGQPEPSLFPPVDWEALRRRGDAIRGGGQ